MAELRFYLDENLPIGIAAQLRARGIVVTTVRDLDLLGDSDVNHLVRATALGCVLCTSDSDYITLAASVPGHAGIIVGRQMVHSLGAWVSALILYHAVYDSDEMIDRLEYLWRG